MIIRRLRSIVPAVAAFFSAGILVVLPGPSRASEPLVVPDGVLTGTVTATTNVDPALAPYLRITMWQAGHAAPTPVQTNPAEGTTIPVDLRGARGETTLELDACSNADEASCSAVASVQRTIIPANPVSFDVSYPGDDRVVVASDESLVATVHDPDVTPGSADALQVTVSSDAGRTTQTVSPEVPTAIDLSAAHGMVLLTAERCSAYAADFCEASTDQHFAWVVHAVTPAVRWNEDEHDFVSGTGHWGALGYFTLSSPLPPDGFTSVDANYDASWQLVDPVSNAVVAGPVSLVTGSTAPGLYFAVDPEKIAGHAIVPGQYVLRVAETARIHGDTLAGSRDIPITFTAEPPAVVRPALRDRTLRRLPGTARSAAWSVPRISTDKKALATFVVTDHRGTVVDREGGILAGCSAGTGCEGGLPPSDLATTYHFSWNGTKTCQRGGCAAAPPGVYGVTALVRDQRGALVPLVLGRVRLMDLASRTETVTKTFHARRVATGRTLTYRLALPRRSMFRPTMLSVLLRGRAIGASQSGRIRVTAQLRGDTARHRRCLLTGGWIDCIDRVWPSATSGLSISGRTVTIKITGLAKATTSLTAIRVKLGYDTWSITGR